MSRLSTLGEALALHRQQRGETLNELSARSGLEVADYEELEAGNHDWSDEHLAALVGSYAIDRAELGRGHALATLDLENGWVSAVPTPTFIDEPDADTVLLTYIALLSCQNRFAIGSQLAIREIDLTVVRRATRASPICRRDLAVEPCPPGQRTASAQPLDPPRARSCCRSGCHGRSRHHPRQQRPCRLSRGHCHRLPSSHDPHS